MAKQKAYEVHLPTYRGCPAERRIIITAAASLIWMSNQSLSFARFKTFKEHFITSYASVLNPGDIWRYPKCDAITSCESLEAGGLK